MIFFQADLGKVLLLGVVLVPLVTVSSARVAAMLGQLCSPLSGRD